MGTSKLVLSTLDFFSIGEHSVSVSFAKCSGTDMLPFSGKGDLRFVEEDGRLSWPNFLTVRSVASS